MCRVVEPELLDDLPPSDPRAIGSRADLRRLNSIMGHDDILSRAFHHHLDEALSRSRPLRLVELGAGDGTLLLRLARRVSAPGLTARVMLLRGKCGERCVCLAGATFSRRGHDDCQFVSAPFPGQIIDGVVPAGRRQNGPVHRVRATPYTFRAYGLPMAPAHRLQRHYAPRCRRERAGGFYRPRTFRTLAGG